MRVVKQLLDVRRAYIIYFFILSTRTFNAQHVYVCMYVCMYVYVYYMCV